MAHGIKVEQLNVRYANGHNALSNVSFCLPIGTVAGLVGINGAGKSTLFKAIMGILPHYSGTVQVMGLSIKEAQRKNLVSYVPQSEDVDWSFPILVRDVVMMGRYGYMSFLRRPSNADRMAVSEALKRMGMSEYADRQIGQLSGGQRKRVFLARSLAQNSKVILLSLVLMSKLKRSSWP
jgi:manganese/iron transport system ATP-binding protein